MERGEFTQQVTLHRCRSSRPTLRLAKAVAARRSPSQLAVGLADVPIIEDEIHWKSIKDVRDTDLDTRIELMLAIDNEAKDDEKIVSTSTGWSDEHIHTELMTSEGMNRVWSFQRSLNQRYGYRQRWQRCCLL